MGKTTVVYVMFLSDVACQKVLNSANVSRSYTQNNTGTVFLRQCIINFVLKFTNFRFHGHRGRSKQTFPALQTQSRPKVTL